MFNLLVMGGGWNGRRDEVSNSRIYITPEQQAELKPGGLLDLEKLRPTHADTCPQKIPDQSHLPAALL